MNGEKLRAQKGQILPFILSRIQNVCEHLPPRAPGSAGEREAARTMAWLLEQECGCESVRIEEFETHPDGFYGYLYFSAALDLGCCACFFFSPWLSILFGLGAVFLMLFQFVLYHEVVDRFFPRRVSTNVTAERGCTGQARRRVFLTGHMDAAWEWPLQYHCGGAVFEAHSVGAVIGVLLYLFLCACKLSGAGAWVTPAGLCGLIFVPFWIGLVFLRNKKRTVDGANDDLTGCFLAIGLLKAMEEAGIRPEHTITGVILTGSEECGLKGAKAWCRAHKNEYGDVPTYIISIDTIHHPRNLMVNERDLNGTVRCDKALAGLIRDAAADLGLTCEKGAVPLMGGATDAAAFAKAGFRAVAVTGLDHRLEPYYHTRGDTFDALDPEGIGSCFEVLARALEKIDAGETDA